MARIIGRRQLQKSISESFLCQFLQTKLPDYICVCMNLSLDRGYEVDALVLVPHIGVFALEVKGAKAISREAGGNCYYFSRGGERILRKNYMPTEVEYPLKKMLREQYHLSPMVYAIECFPYAEPELGQYQDMAGEYMLKHTLWKSDFQSGTAFLQKLYSLYFDDIQNRDIYYDDMDDELVDYLARSWYEEKKPVTRPEKPPMVFLSYNSNNNSTARHLKKELESAGIFVWRAPEDIPLGEYYLPVEMNAIEECEAVVLLLSPAAQESAEVEKEVRKAMACRKKIYPILLGLSKPNELYQTLMTQHQWREMEDFDPAVISELINVIKGQ